MNFVDNVVLEPADEFVRFFVMCKHAHQIVETFMLSQKCLLQPLTPLL